MRLRGRVDANQAATVKALRQIGCSVAITSNVGGGFPDLVVSRGAWTGLLEMKDGSLPPSARRLTDDEYDFHQKWAGWIGVAESPEQAVRMVLEASK